MKKICTSCGLKKPYNEFNKDSSRPDGLCIYCRECSQENYRTLYQRDETILDGIRDRRAKWSVKKKKETKDQKKADSKKYVDDITDSYVRNILVQKHHIAREDITPEMIEEKKKDIITYRNAQKKRIINYYKELLKVYTIIYLYTNI